MASASETARTNARRARHSDRTESATTPPPRRSPFEPHPRGLPRRRGHRRRPTSLRKSTTVARPSSSPTQRRFLQAGDAGPGSRLPPDAQSVTRTQNAASRTGSLQHFSELHVVQNVELDRLKPVRPIQCCPPNQVERPDPTIRPRPASRNQIRLSSRREDQPETRDERRLEQPPASMSGNSGRWSIPRATANRTARRSVSGS